MAYVLEQDASGTTATNFDMYIDNYTSKYATKFDYSGSTGTITRIVLYLDKVLSPTYNLNAYIYTHDSGANEPDAVVGTGSSAVAASGLTTSEAAYNFDSVSAALANGTTYWLVMVASAGPDASNYVQWHADEPASARTMSGFGTAGSESWNLQSGSKRTKFDLYSGGNEVNVTPVADLLSGTGSQSAPTISGSAVNAPNHIAQAAELKDPTLATTQNLGVGNYRSTTVQMNW
jgi:hypothetical protein